MPKRYLGMRGISAACGITEATVRSYRRYEKLPEPDVCVDHRPGWAESTIARWQARRLRRISREVRTANRVK